MLDDVLAVDGVRDARTATSRATRSSSTPRPTRPSADSARPRSGSPGTSSAVLTLRRGARRRRDPTRSWSTPPRPSAHDLRVGDAVEILFTGPPREFTIVGHRRVRRRGQPRRAPRSRSSSSPTAQQVLDKVGRLRRDHASTPRTACRPSELGARIAGGAARRRRGRDSRDGRRRERRRPDRTGSASSRSRSSCSPSSRCSSARSSSSTRSRSSSPSGRVSWRCCGRSARAGARCWRRCLVEAVGGRPRRLGGRDRGRRSDRDRAQGADGALRHRHPEHGTPAPAADGDRLARRGDDRDARRLVPARRARPPAWRRSRRCARPRGSRRRLAAATDHRRASSCTALGAASRSCTGCSARPRRSAPARRLRRRGHVRRHRDALPARSPARSRARLGAPLRRLGIHGQLGRENAMRNPRRTASTASALMIGLGARLDGHDPRVLAEGFVQRRHSRRRCGGPHVSTVVVLDVQPRGGRPGSGRCRRSQPSPSSGRTCSGSTAQQLRDRGRPGRRSSRSRPST